MSVPENTPGFAVPWGYFAMPVGGGYDLLDGVGLAQAVIRQSGPGWEASVLDGHGEYQHLVTVPNPGELTEPLLAALAVPPAPSTSTVDKPPYGYTEVELAACFLRPGDRVAEVVPLDQPGQPDTIWRKVALVQFCPVPASSTEPRAVRVTFDDGGSSELAELATIRAARRPHTSELRAEFGQMRSVPALFVRVGDLVGELDMNAAPGSRDLQWFRVVAVEDPAVGHVPAGLGVPGNVLRIRYADGSDALVRRGSELTIAWPAPAWFGDQGSTYRVEPGKQQQVTPLAVPMSEPRLTLWGHVHPGDIVLMSEPSLPDRLDHATWSRVTEVDGECTDLSCEVTCCGGRIELERGATMHRDARDEVVVRIPCSSTSVPEQPAGVSPLPDARVEEITDMVRGWYNQSPRRVTTRALEEIERILTRAIRARYAPGFVAAAYAVIAMVAAVRTVRQVPVQRTTGATVVDQLAAGTATRVDGDRPADGQRFGPLPPQHMVNPVVTEQMYGLLGAVGATGGVLARGARAIYAMTLEDCTPDMTTLLGLGWVEEGRVVLPVTAIYQRTAAGEAEWKRYLAEQQSDQQ